MGNEADRVEPASPRECSTLDSDASRANHVRALWLIVTFGEQGMGLLPATLGLSSNGTRWRLLNHLRPLYPAPVAWRLSQLALRITKTDDEPALFTSVRNEADRVGAP
jgi:hypothetical protein